MKLVGARLGDVVDLRGAVAALIDGIGERVDGHFGNRVEAKHQIGGKPAVEIGERVVGLQAINDVAVRERGQAVELHVAVTVSAADEVVATARGVDERSRGKLQWISQVAAGIGQVFERRRIQGRGGVGVVGVDNGGFRGDVHCLLGLRDFELEVDGLLLPQTGGNVAGLCGLEALRFGTDRVRARQQLREIEASRIVCLVRCVSGPCRG